MQALERRWTAQVREGRLRLAVPRGSLREHASRDATRAGRKPRVWKRAPRTSRARSARPSAWRPAAGAWRCSATAARRRAICSRPRRSRAGEVSRSTGSMLGESTRPDAAITAIAAPPVVHLGDTVPLTLTIHSTVPARAVLSVRHQRCVTPPASRSRLRAGDNPLLLLYTAAAKGWQSFQATVSLPGDAVSANNSLAAVTDVVAAPRVLSVGGAHSSVPGLLAHEGMSVTQVEPASLPSSAAGYSGQDAVVLDDVAASAAQRSAGRGAERSRARRRPRPRRARRTAQLLARRLRALAAAAGAARVEPRARKPAATEPRDLARARSLREHERTRRRRRKDRDGARRRDARARRSCAPTRTHSASSTSTSSPTRWCRCSCSRARPTNAASIAPSPACRPTAARTSTSASKRGLGTAARQQSRAAPHHPDDRRHQPARELRAAARPAAPSAHHCRDGGARRRRRPPPARRNRRRHRGQRLRHRQRERTAADLRQRDAVEREARARHRSPVRSARQRQRGRALVDRQAPARAGRQRRHRTQGRRTGRPAREQHRFTARPGARGVAGRDRPRGGVDARPGQLMGRRMARGDRTLERRRALDRARRCAGAADARAARLVGLAADRPCRCGRAGARRGRDRRARSPTPTASCARSASCRSVRACTTPTSRPWPAGVYRFALHTVGAVRQSAAGALAIGYPAEYSPVSVHVSPMAQLVAQAGGRIVPADDLGALGSSEHSQWRLLALLALAVFLVGVAGRMLSSSGAARTSTRAV